MERHPATTTLARLCLAAAACLLAACSIQGLRQTTAAGDTLTAARMTFGVREEQPRYDLRAGTYEAESHDEVEGLGVASRGLSTIYGLDVFRDIELGKQAVDRTGITEETKRLAETEKTTRYLEEQETARQALELEVAE